MSVDLEMEKTSIAESDFQQSYDYSAYSISEMESDSGISEALSYSVMQNKENSWISQEIIQEYKDKLQSNQFDLNGCDVTLISVTKEKFFA